MPLTLAALQLNAEHVGALGLPSLVVDTSQVGAIRLQPAFVGELPVGGARLSPLILTNAGPTTYTHTPAGSVLVSGGASVGGGGSISGDPLVALTGSGGAQLSGLAVVQLTDVTALEFYPRGGAKATGTAATGYTWVQMQPSGGATISGGAIVSFPAAPVGPLNASLPHLSMLATDGSVQSPITATLPKLTVSISATAYEPGGVLAVRMPVVTGAYSALSGRAATLAVTLPRVTMLCSGGNNRLSAALPKLGVSFTALGAALGYMGMQSPRFTAAFFAQAATTGDMRFQSPRLSAVLIGRSAVLGTLTPQLQPLQIKLRATAATLGTLSLKSKALSGAFAGYTQIVGKIALHLTPLQFASVGYKPATQVLTQVTNTLTNSVTNYVNFPYNSFAEFGGRYLAAGPTGLYQVDVGDSDTGVAIDATMGFGQTDFSSEYQKRLSDFYLAMRSDGDIKVAVCVDERDPVEYTLSPLAVSTLKQRRTPFGKGLRGKYWQFALSNTDGANFDFDTMNVAAVPLDRRI